jgi:hypothetical protein
MRMRVLAVTLLTGCAGATAAIAADLGENTTIGGRVFFDVSHISLQNENAAGSKIDTPPTGTGFDVKRFYLIVDHRFNDVWAANLTTDAQFSTASTATITASTGTTTVLTNQNSSGGVSEVFIKKLYLEGKFNNLLVVHAGSYDMPWDPFAESLYAYRYVEKTITDRLGYSNTTDWGLNASGTGGTNGVFSYAASVVNGGGFKNPTRTKGVDFEARVSAKPTKWLTAGVGFYSGHLGQINAANEDFPRNTATRFDAAAGVVVSGLRAGVEYFNARNYKTVNSLTASVLGTSSVVNTALVAPISDKADGISSYASYSFPNNQISVFARFDTAKLSKDVASSLKETYFNAGVAYKPMKTLDFALVYKNEKVENGSTSVSGADANGSYTIGGANGARDGTFEEVGLYAQWGF